MSKSIVFLLAGCVLTSAAAYAGQQVSASTDLNIRSGPGSKYPVIGVLRAGRTATTAGCGNAARWCGIELSGQRGWIYAKYLSARAAAPDAEQGASEVSQHPASVDPTTTSAVASSVALPDVVRKYAATHRPLPVDFEGEPSVGASFPAGIRLRDIPGSAYQYVYVGQRPVFVDRQSRRIVQVGH